MKLKTDALLQMRGWNTTQTSTTTTTSSSSYTVITATLAEGTPITGTFVLQTISEYTHLRQSVTTTTTTTDTEGIATAIPIVIAPGGLAWFLWGFRGITGAAEALINATPEIKDHPEDQSCPEHKDNCADALCSGVDGMCTAGPNSGCACEDKECPSENRNCFDCAGQDGKCTQGDESGCDCDCPPESSRPSCSDANCEGDENFRCTSGSDCSCCPDGESTLDCELDCGGDQGDKTCSGLPDQNYLFKSCFCMAGEESLVLTAPDDLSDQAVLESLQNLPDLTPSSLDFPQDQESICQNFALAVPQRDGDGSPSVGTAIADWCSQMDGVAIKKQPDGVDAVFQMWPFSYYSFWLSTRYWYQDDPYKCADQVTIYEDGCVNSLTKAMIDCDPDSGGTHGAAYPYDCIYYNITIDYGQYEYSPPWNPLPEEIASGTCDTNQSSGIVSSFWDGIYPQFCAEVEEEGDGMVVRDYTSADFASQNRQRLLGHAEPWRTTPPSSSSYPPQWGNPWGFHFEATAELLDDQGSIPCGRTCTESMTTLSRSCGTAGEDQNSMAAEGIIDAGCRKYSYRIVQPNTDETICAKKSYPGEVKSFTLDDANIAIEAFCSDELAKVTNPAQSPPTSEIDQWTGLSPYPQRFYRHADAFVAIMAVFTDALGIGQFEGCNRQDSDFMVKDYADRCKEILWEAVNNCDTQTTTEKYGGAIFEHDGDNGCVLWQIWGFH